MPRWNRQVFWLLVGVVLLVGPSLSPAAVDAALRNLNQLQYQWYQNVDGVQPATPLAAQNTRVVNSARGTVYHLRISARNSGAALEVGDLLKLQFATSTSGPWTDVGDLGSEAAWRGYDNPTPADGDAITSTLLTSSTAEESYEEANSASVVSRITGSGVGEWGWVVQNNAAAPATIYYFRMVQGNGDPLAGYTTYPQIATPGVIILPNRTGSGAPESVVSYTHLVINLGRGADTFEMTSSSGAGWAVDLYLSDGVTPLADTDGDGTPDTGSLASGGMRTIVAKVTVGWSALSDTTAVTATSSADSTVQSSVTNTTTAPATIRISISDATADFGSNLDPSGPASNSADTVLAAVSGTGTQGTYYVWKSASGTGMAVTVKSNKPWDGTLSAAENAGTSPTLTVASGVWRYAEGSAPSSYSGCASTAAFTTALSPWKAGVGPGVAAYTHFYCLRIDWTDTPGTFTSTATYSVTQQ
ncbi:MAG: hypothetical protein HY683_09110 [Chloroflexi bacterium]|nr:hypothetical protein [Chloroflexota bacterium]